MYMNQFWNLFSGPLFFFFILLPIHALTLFYNKLYLIDEFLHTSFFLRLYLWPLAFPQKFQNQLVSSHKHLLEFLLGLNILITLNSLNLEHLYNTKFFNANKFIKVFYAFDNVYGFLCRDEPHLLCLFLGIWYFLELFYVISLFFSKFYLYLV